MRIVHVYKDYHPPVRGGVEQTIERMARWQVAAGHEVSVLVSASGGRHDLVEEIDGVRVVRVAEWARALSSPICPGFPRALARERADLWHLHSPNPLGEVSYRWARPEGALLITYHGDVTKQKPLLPLYRPLVHALFREANVLHATSSRALDRPGSLVKPFHERFRVVPLGVDAAPLFALDRSRPAAGLLRERYGDPHLLFVGRLRYYKGLHVLLDAMPAIEAPLVIVGNGPMDRALRAQAARLGLDDRVHFVGPVSDDVLLDHLAAAGIGLLPSSTPTEAFGLALVEYMAAGLPVVCTELGTGTSFVNQHGETGLVVRANDPGALADAVNRLLADRALRERMGRAGRERVRDRFTTEVMMRGMDCLYGEATRLAGARRR
ncbi:MAG TPA: glycosyltransferase [Candidatus Eisenbacteria bacterium]|jgi:rhamnosyl/mannosyltransferase